MIFTFQKKKISNPYTEKKRSRHPSPVTSLVTTPILLNLINNKSVVTLVMVLKYIKCSSSPSQASPSPFHVLTT